MHIACDRHEHVTVSCKELSKHEVTIVSGTNGRFITNYTQLTSLTESLSSSTSQSTMGVAIWLATQQGF